MAGCFTIGDEDIFVTNMRFYSLMDWAIEVAPEIKDESQVEYLSKFEERNENLWSPCTHINFRTEFNPQEALYWAKVFQAVAFKIFERKVGNQSSVSWQPYAIYNAMKISAMLQKLSGESVDPWVPGYS